MTGVEFPSGPVMGLTLFATASRLALGLTKPPIQWISGAKRPGREADHSPTSIVEVKGWVELPPLPQYVFMAWCSAKAQGRIYLFYFTFTNQSVPINTW